MSHKVNSICIEFPSSGSSPVHAGWLSHSGVFSFTPQFTCSYFQTTFIRLHKFIPGHKFSSKTLASHGACSSRSNQMQTRCGFADILYTSQKCVIYLIRAKISKKIKPLSYTTEPLSTDQSQLLKCDWEWIPHKDRNLRQRH